MKKDVHYEFVDMMEYVSKSNLKGYYYAGGQIELLQDAFDVEWILLEMDNYYEGEWYAIFKMNEKWHLLNGYFGSCSGCDDLEDEDPLTWLENHVKNVRAFGSVIQAMCWLETTDEFSYTPSVKSCMLRELERVHR
ncbi:hypothetical protein ACFL2R_00735 [Patescibacteria group bacterium]